jgi:predicted tellurium resistance membrane protein TerC
MIEHPERVDQFKQDIAAMQVRDPAAGRDRLFSRGGLTLMIIGVIVAIAGYVQSHGTTNPLGQRDAIIIGLVGVTLSVIGSALFLRGSIASFLRFWLARSIYEQKAQTDRIVDKLSS